MTTIRALGFALALTGCIDHGPVENQADASRTLEGATVTLLRYPEVCGQTPVFDDGDLYSLAVSGSAAVTPPLIEVSFHPTLPVAQALPVDLDPFGVLSYSTDANGNMIDVVYGQQGTLPLSTDNMFEWEQGADASAVDDQPISTATVTIDAMPGADAATGTLTVRMVFGDGGIFDARVSAPIDETFSGCPAG
ncbi:MAG TPA: hypothetical protein VH143_15765 [Kofleriaceae bacterium]|jgi:hypothetical protein|nr:hypothetical protein [Kofleriaceae bacterium]